MIMDGEGQGGDIDEPASERRVYTVLVADDAPATRRVLVELLEDTSDLYASLLCATPTQPFGGRPGPARHRSAGRHDAWWGRPLRCARYPGGFAPDPHVGLFGLRRPCLGDPDARSGARLPREGVAAQDLIDGLRRCASGYTALSEGPSEHLVAEMGELGRAEQADSAAARARYERLLKLLEPGGSTPTYQPVVNLRTGGLAGYEALTSFGKQLGSTTEEIFREAHQVGLGVELELHTARLAVSGFSPERARSPETYLTVNASPGLLYRPALLEVLSQLPAEPRRRRDHRAAPVRLLRPAPRDGPARA